MKYEENCDCAFCLREADLRRDAKRRKQEWDRENGEGNGFIYFVVVVAVALIIGNAVLMWVY